jgi:hypothetical protein
MAEKRSFLVTGRKRVARLPLNPDSDRRPLGDRIGWRGRLPCTSIDPASENVKNLLGLEVEKLDGDVLAMKDIVCIVRGILADDFQMPVSPRILRLPGTISDVARLGDWILQKAGLYATNPRPVGNEPNYRLQHRASETELRYRPLIYLKERIRRSVAWCVAQGIPISFTASVRDG